MSARQGKMYARACIPPGMDLALEGLAREVLREQPRDIYLFAAQHFEKLVKLRDEAAHNAGLSPSSTQGSDNAGLIDESPTETKKQLITEDQPLSSLNLALPVAVEVPSIPVIDIQSESGTNGSSKTGTGHIGPGVAAFAASTGTIAILGATADKGKEVLGGVVKSVDNVVASANQVREDAVEAAATAQKDAEALVGNVQESVVKDVEGVKEGILKEAEGVKESVEKEVAGVKEGILKEAEGVKESVEKEVEGVKESVVKDVVGVKEGILKEAEGVKESVEKEVEGVKESVVKDVEGVKESVVKEVEGVKDRVLKEAEGVKESVEKEVEDVKESVKETVEAAAREGDKVTQQVEAVVEKAEQAKEGVLEKAEQAKEGVLEKAEQAKSDLMAKVEQTKENIEQTKQELVANVEQRKDDLITKAEDTKDNLIGKGDDILGKAEQIKEDFTAKAEETKDDLTGKAEDVLGKAIQAKDDIIEKAVESKENLIGKVDDILGKAEQTKEDLIAKAVQVKDDVSEKAEKTKDDFVSKAEETKDNLIGKVDDILGKAEQTKEDLIGKAEQAKDELVQRVEEGKDDVAQKVDQAKESVANEVDSVKKEVEDLVDKADQTKNNVVETVNQTKDDVLNKVEEVSKGAAGLMGKAGKVKEDFVNQTEDASESLSKSVDQVKAEVVSVVEASVQKEADLLAEKVDETKENITQKVENVTNELKVLAENSENTIDQTKSDVLHHVEDVKEGAIDLVKKAETAQDELVEKAEKTRDDVAKSVDQVQEEIVKEVEAKAADLTEKVEQSQTDLVETVVQVKDDVIHEAEDVAKEAEVLVEKVKDEAVNEAEEVVKEAVAVKDAVAKNLVENAENVAQVREIAQKEVDEVVEKAERVMEEAVSTSTSPHDLLARLSRPSSNKSDIRLPSAEIADVKASEAEDDTFPEPPPPEESVSDEQTLANVSHMLAEEKALQRAIDRMPRVIDVETIVKDTTSSAAQKSADVVVEPALEEIKAIEQDLADSAATTIQATFRGHQTRQNLKKTAEDNLDDFPPPPPDMDNLATIDEKDASESSSEQIDLQPVVDVAIKTEPHPSRSESLAETEEKSTLTAESEPESLDEVHRAASTLSESTVSVGDSLSAMKGSETDSVNALSVTSEEAGDKLGTAATTIQASFRGYQTRQNLQKIADEEQMPLPEPIQDLQQFEDPPDEDDLPPPPDECDLHEPADDVSTDTPRSPETGEKLTKSSSTGQGGDPPAPQLSAEEQLALLQRPQECAELPEHRGVEAEEERDLAASSAEVDDSSLDSAATKIQAGARGYLTRKHMKDTFSTTAPSMTDSQQSVGTVLTSQDEDAVQTSGSLETEVQRQSLDASENLGVTAVVIATASDKDVNEKEVPSGKALSLDSQPTERKKKVSIKASSMQCPGPDASTEDLEVWATLQSGLQDAATTIQSNFRGYRTRQKLHRENAVQMPTTSSGTPTTTSESSEATPAVVRSSGEFHDMLVLPTSDASVGYDALAARQTSTIGKHPEGHVTPPGDVKASGGVGVAQNIVIKMGKATEAAPALAESREASIMKGESAVNAATKIQAGFRGYKVRKQMKQIRAEKPLPKRKRRGSQSAHGQEKVRIKETSLQDRSATKIQAGVRGFLVRKRRQEERDAAVKIQAGFRGYKVRRDVKRAPVEK